jgi:biopolymer transport protein ExbD
MADFPPPSLSHDKGKRKTKKLSTRVDLTPMVDLGFLLITFFIFTTSMTEPKSLKLVMPDDLKVIDSTNLPESGTLQLVLARDDQVWYYNGTKLAGIQKTSYGNELRKIIIYKKKTVHKVLGNEDEMTLVIKPTKSSSLKNIVDIMDEVLINQVKHYIITEPLAEDLKRVQEN